MAIKMDDHTIDTLVFNASNGTTVTKTLTEEGGATVDSLDIYDKTKIAEWTETINLKDDTTFDSVTPSSTAQTIKSTSYITTHDVELDLASYAYVVFVDVYNKYVYNNAKTVNYTDEQARTYVHFVGRNVQNASSNFSIGLGATYGNSGARVISGNSSAYGVYPPSAPNISLSSNTSTSPTLQVQSPALSVRTGTTASLDDLQDIDSANMNIEVQYSIYRLPKATFYQTINDNVVAVLED